MVPSPKVATYDKQPEMSVQGVADKVAEVVKTNEYDFIMCNFAPPDMVSLQVIGWFLAYTRLATPVYMTLLSSPLAPPTRPSRLSTTRVKKPVTFSA